MKEVDDKSIIKPRNEQTNDEKNKVQFNLRAKNIVTSALNRGEFYMILNCETAKKMWDTLQVTHKGTSEIKRARTNTLIREYELFMMEKGESIQDMQMRFTHIVNQLVGLGKDIPNEDLIIKFCDV